jgi:hypothetical protein
MPGIGKTRGDVLVDMTFFRSIEFTLFWAILNLLSLSLYFLVEFVIYWCVLNKRPRNTLSDIFMGNYMVGFPLLGIKNICLLVNVIKYYMLVKYRDTTQASLKSKTPGVKKLFTILDKCHGCHVLNTPLKDTLRICKSWVSKCHFVWLKHNFPPIEVLFSL